MRQDEQQVRILLYRAALLAREGNHAAAIRVLLDADDDLFSSAPSRYSTEIRKRRKTQESDPLLAPVLDLDLDAKTLNFLTERLGIVTIIDFDRWSWDDIGAAARKSKVSVAKIKQALDDAGLTEILEQRKQAGLANQDYWGLKKPQE